MLKPNTRIPGLDLLRVAACYMVIQVHAGEFYYIAAGGEVAAGSAPAAVNLLNSLCRVAVPLFVMLSGYFLLPVRGSVRLFFSRRFVRVVIPFVVWCVLYAVYRSFRGESEAGLWADIARIPVNFGVEVGHLWYVYMLMGLYLFAPVISPWLQTASRRAVECFLGVWCVTLCLPYLHLLFPAWWGECFWNRTPMLYYFSGFLGYMVLAFYLRRYASIPRARHAVWGAVLILAGYAATSWIFHRRLATSLYVSDLELSWGFDTINVAMMCLGVFLLLRGVRGTGRAGKLITDISKLSYGIFLAHIMVLNFFFSLLDPLVNPVAVKIPLMALCTFGVTYAGIKLLSLLPESKYLVG